MKSKQVFLVSDFTFGGMIRSFCNPSTVVSSSLEMIVKDFQRF